MEHSWQATYRHVAPVFIFIDLCAYAEVIAIDYGGFKIEYAYLNRTTLRYEYVLYADTGSATRPSSFYHGPHLPASFAQQTSIRSYARIVKGWERGYLVIFNHMDYDGYYIGRANCMTNIVPQVASFNQGLWAKVEEVVAECYRDLAPVATCPKR